MHMTIIQIIYIFYVILLSLKQMCVKYDSLVLSNYILHWIIFVYLVGSGQMFV